MTTNNRHPDTMSTDPTLPGEPLTDDDSKRAAERDSWIRRKQGELMEMVPWLDEADRDRESGNLTDDERASLAKYALEKGRELTRPEANWWLAGIRRYRDW